MAYRYFKDLTRKKVSDKILRDKAFNITKNLKYDGYQCGPASMSIKFLMKKLLVVTLKMRIFQTKN